MPGHHFSVNPPYWIFNITVEGTSKAVHFALCELAGTVIPYEYNGVEDDGAGHAQYLADIFSSHGFKVEVTRLGVEVDPRIDQPGIGEWVDPVPPAE